MTDLQGKRIAIVSSDFFEKAELMEPLEKLREFGAKVDVVGSHAGALKAMKHDVQLDEEVPVDKTIEEAIPDEYDAVVLPGGVVNADHLRVNKAAQTFVRRIAEAHKPVAAVCHAPWLLISSGLVNGKTMTSYHTLADDMKNAGANWVDEEVVVDDIFITSRKPDDLPAFMGAISDTLTGSV